MILNKVKIPNSFTVKVEYSGACNLKENDIVLLSLNSDKVYLSKRKNNFENSGTNEASNTVEIKIREISDKKKIEKFMSRNEVSLVSVSNIDKSSNEIILDVKVFFQEEVVHLDIYFDDEFLEKYKRFTGIRESIDISKELRRDFLHFDNSSFAFGGFYITTGEYSSKKNKNTYSGKEEEKEEISDLILIGSIGTLQIKLESNEKNEQYLKIKSIKKNIKSENYVFRLLRDKINFVNISSDFLIRQEGLHFLEKYKDSLDSYIKTWDKYGEIEKKRIIDKFKNIGVLEYSSFDINRKSEVVLSISNHIDIDNFVNNLEDGDTFHFLERSPREFLEDFRISKYNAYIAKEKQPLYASYVEVDKKRNKIHLALSDGNFKKSLPDYGYIALNISGDMSRFNRREEAKENIVAAKSGLPNLIQLLEGEQSTRPKKRDIDPLSEKIKKEVFQNEPTKGQLEAIKVALETPDIALIQGPPGTGKTTVITAILKRINELNSEEGLIWGENLITSYQHDAVENAIGRMTINGIPVMKVGKRYQENTSDYEEMESSGKKWIFETKEKIYNSYPHLENLSISDDFKELYEDYILNTDTLEDAIKILEKVKSIFLNNFQEKLFIESMKLIEKLKFQSNLKSENENIKAKVDEIPEDESSLENFNHESIYRIFRYLSNENKEYLKDELNILEALIDLSKEKIEKNEFSKLKEVKKDILEKLTEEKYSFKDSQFFPEVDDLLTNALDKNYEIRYKKGNVESVVLEFIDELENNPYEIKRALEEYSSVIGATCQQAVNSTIKEKKDDEIWYKNVLIDEAARCNPLDLFIPMAKASERIILVGDHRQLPHLVEEDILHEVEENMSSGDSEDVKEKIKENIKISLFEKLFKSLKELEKKDGIKRVVTLDKQFRTHPILGNFVSKHFYEKHGEVHIDSPRVAKEFTHSLPGLENKACVWLDVPQIEGKEVAGISKYRPSEAKKIANHIKKMLDSEGALNRSFGIITFYRRQVEEILFELSKVGISEKNDEGNYELKAEYQYENGKEKIRIGTVDSFQGMEFDFVYLSVVRSNTFSKPIQKYGHLMIENRLCVSMSRQKRMLILVGDSKMFLDSQGKKCVNSLYEYYKMCEREVEFGAII